MGREATDGSFAAFCNRISNAALVFDGVNVVYQSPSQGQLEFGWTGALRQDGRKIELHEYPRYRNPYMQADFAADKIDIRPRPTPALPRLECAISQIQLIGNIP